MRPFITVEQKAQNVLELYESIFPDFSLISKTYHANPYENLIMMAEFSIRGQEILISDSFISHDWDITPGISFFLELDSEEELTNFGNSLSKGGKVHMPAGNYGFSKQFTWVEDAFGVNWQLNLE